MPGGPTDPTAVMQAVQQSGYTWVSNHLLPATGSPATWLAVDTQNNWQLTTSAAVCLDQSTFESLRQGAQSGPFVIVAGSRFQLSRVVLQGVAWAVLEPA